LPLVFSRAPHNLLTEYLGMSGICRRSTMSDGSSAPVPARKPLSPAAERALAEADARRQAAAASSKPMAREIQGPKGPEPTRFGDWENKGIASDF
jgi:hypothetical protein